MSKRFLYCMVLGAVCFPCIGATTPIGKVTDIVVSKNGIGPKNEGCSSFKVTPAQVRAFLDKAVLLSGSQQHDFFLHGPCSAQGTLKTRYDTWQWQIRNMGTATITATNGDTFVLGNPERESTLADDGPGLAHADGVPLTAGRYAGKVVVFDLTVDQKKAIEHFRTCHLANFKTMNQFTPYVFELTAAQSKVVSRAAGVSPRYFEVHETYRGFKDAGPY